MEPSRGEESGKLYSPDDQGEYAPESDAHKFSVQGLSALMVFESEVTVVQPPTEEYALMLEVTMADCPGHPCPPTFSWNAGMVMHVLKGDPTLRDLEHVQVDGPGVAYLFFFDKQGCRGLKHNATEALRTHVAEAFSEWISCSTHFAIIPLPLVEGWHWTVAPSERHQQRSRAEHPDCPMHNLISSESDSAPQLVGSAPTSMAHLGQTEETGVAAPLGHPFLGQEEDPLRDAP